MSRTPKVTLNRLSFKDDALHHSHKPDRKYIESKIEDFISKPAQEAAFRIKNSQAMKPRFTMLTIDFAPEPSTSSSEPYELQMLLGESYHNEQ